VRDVYAEVIGDPIAHSKSPAIHGFWLERLDIAGAYRAVRVSPDELTDHLMSRRDDPDWRGCNVTAPLKQSVMHLLDEIDEAARTIGAINCVLPRRNHLVGSNTDVDGVAAALVDAVVAGKRIAVIGGGGAARAAIHYLGRQGAGEIHVLLRDPARGESLRSLASGLEIRSIAEAAAAFDGAAAIVNASPLGMVHASPMPPALLDALSRAAPGATAFDMVYDPVETPFLAAARAAGHRTADGLLMLVGQARHAFALFFGENPPHTADAELRNRLLGI
jgi:shikimate dehydrogenase